MLTFVGLSHAENMAYCAAWRVPDDYQAVLKHPEANDPSLSIVLPPVFDFGSQPIEDRCGILKIKSAVGQSPGMFGWIVGDAHRIIVYTTMGPGKRDAGEGCL